MYMDLRAYLLSAAYSQAEFGKLQGLLARVLDHNRHVQEAACSAFATLAEEAGLDLTPRLEVPPSPLAPRDDQLQFLALSMSSSASHVSCIDTIGKDLLTFRLHNEEDGSCTHRLTWAVDGKPKCAF